MGYLIDLDSPTPVLCTVHRVPGPVRLLMATDRYRGNLFLEWKPPRGVMVQGYRIERTREGRRYELLRETQAPECYLVNLPPGEPWFYRVTAFNARGAGRARQVFFFQRGYRLSSGRFVENRLMRVPVVPGLRVDICELGEP